MSLGSGAQADVRAAWPNFFNIALLAVFLFFSVFLLRSKELSWKCCCGATTPSMEQQSIIWTGCFKKSNLQVNKLQGSVEISVKKTQSKTRALLFISLYVFQTLWTHLFDCLLLPFVTFLIRNLSSFFPFYNFALQKNIKPLLIIFYFWLVWSKLIKAFLHSTYFVLTFCFDPISADFSWILCDRLQVCRTKCLKCVCTGRKSKLCSYGCCHFLRWQKCLSVGKWGHCEGEPHSFQ